MDAFAKGLLVAHQMIQDKALSKFIEERYSSHNSGIGQQIMSGKVDMEDVDKWVRNEKNPVLQSGRQEMLEDIINSYIF